MENIIVEARSRQMWAAKSTPTKDKDFVVIGDSRIYRGVDTEIISSYLDMNGMNLGFSSAGMSSPLFDLAESFLRSNGERIIIIGLTANSLTEESAKNLHLKEWTLKPTIDRFAILCCESFMILTGPKLFELNNGDKNYLQTYHLNGFVASDYQVRNSREAIKSYKETFEKNHISGHVIEGLLDRIKKWKNEKIEVYFFVPPISKDLWDVEEKQTGFYSSNIFKLLSDAGAMQIPVEGEWTSYDGSHLTAGDAVRLSRVLAEAVGRRSKETMTSK